MKKFLHVALVLLLAATSLQAGNRYLQDFENYSVMSMGGNVLRFTIPIWVYGEGDDNTYYLNPHSANNDNKRDSYLWYSLTTDGTPSRGASSVHRIVSFGGARTPNYDGRKSGGVGYAYALVGDGAGAVVIRNTYSGQPLTLLPGDNSHWVINNSDGQSENQRIEVTRTNTTYGKYTVYLSMDWYIPEDLQGKQFYIGLNVCDYYVKDNDEHNNYFWKWNEVYTGENIQSPELFDPYFYAVSADGSKPKGKAGIAYTTYQDVKKYSTSLDPGHQITTDQRSGVITVDMQDTIRTVYATFTVVPDKDVPAVTQDLRSNRVEIPAYHKIYNFAASEVLDDKESVTGDVTLSWNTMYPAAEDVISGDIFEIQRATQEDFSDAESIGMEMLSETTSHYEYTDESENVRRVLSADSTNTGKLSSTQLIPIYRDGEEIATIQASMESNMYSPGSTLHYRIRRASAAVWNWEESDWMKTTSLVKHDYLAPLAEEQPNYVLDPEFEDNRKVHFTILINNQAVTSDLDPVESLPFQYNVREFANKLPIETHYTVRWGAELPEGTTFTFYQPWNGNQDPLPLTVESEGSNYITYRTTVHNGTNVILEMRAGGEKLCELTSIDPLYETTVTIRRYEYTIHGTPPIVRWEAVKASSQEKDLHTIVAPYIDEDSVKNVLYNDLIIKASQVNYGRCSWDKNAKLILIRKYVETGETMEFVIPKDSIMRQEDGSWVAHFTNEAARSCVHYEYSVRLDQSNSTLKVQNPTTQLNSKPISGAELYRNEVAHIDTIGSQGDKKGVLLTWQPSAGSIDDYTLTRREKGVAGTDTVLVVQSNEGFYDESAEPGVTYVYEVMASYTCQGTLTTNSAAVEGTRLAFGSIAGRVQYEDGTGCYGVEVKIENGDDVVRTTLTDETGAFLFDSLYYTAGSGKQTTYVITPTSQNAVFHFNNTSSPTATVTLNKNNCEVENLYFDNISAVVFSGRVLYKNSSVPVRDANILLNGKLVKRSGEAYKTDVSGNFEINVPKNSAFTFQIVKEGHTFEGDGFVRIDGDSLLTLNGTQPSVRIWDLTKVRLAGRIVGGQDQAALPLGHGLSKNNLGDNIQLVLELEGDNISWIVRDPNDLTKDTLEFAVVHNVYDSVGNAESVGVTRVHYQKKRILIDVDPATGEYQADLFPTKYKVIQATARGYATLFEEGKTGEAIDLSNAVLTQDTVTYNDKIAVSNSQFSITYRSPIVVTYKQYRYGMEYDYYGEKTYKTKNIAGADVKIDLAKQDSLGHWNYLFNAPVFPAGSYQFRVSAHEDYYYNNDRANKPDVVKLKAGNLKVYNGMQETTSIKEYPLDQNGSALVEVLANHVTYVHEGDMALRQLDFSVESEGDYIEAEPLRAYILGAIEKRTDYLEMDTVSAGITLLDVLRDPPGSASYATLEKGTKYHVKFKEYTNYRFGVDLIFKYGNNTEYYVGTYAGTPAAGTAAGVISVVQKTSDWHMPISVEYDKQTQSDYEITTTERISTSSDPYNVGSMADVYIGTTNGVMTGKSLAFRVVDSLSYEMLASQRESGAALVVAQGTDENGSPWYLMRTEDILVKNAITSTFAYTQEHIINTIIPNLFDYRDALLLVGTEAQAKAAADKSGKYIFWSHVAPSDSTFGLSGSYQIVKAANYNGATVDKVDAANAAILNWLKVIAENERVKLNSFYSTPFQTVSISGGVTQSYSESYTYSDFIFDYWGYSHLPGLSDRVTGKAQSGGIGGFWFSLLKDKIWNRWYKGLDMTKRMSDLLVTKNGQSEEKSPGEYVKVAAGNAEFDFDFDPIMDMGAGMIPENGMTAGESKTTTATFAPGANEHLTFQIFKSVIDDFNDRAEDSRETASSNNDNATDPDLIMFGSLLYRTLGGATQCPWEPADSTMVYYQGQPLNYPTLKIENPQIVIDKHELSNIPHDGEGYFTLTMWNEIEENNGLATGSQGVKFNLKLDENTNPKGLEIIIDGQPLTDGREFRFVGSTPITKTVKVRAAKEYDYEDICLKLESQCTSTLTYQKACFSVHFMPVSSPVRISTPSDKWIMNTLSPQDEQGYYMPVSIDGFDVNYDNFDHIELQYKLVTQPNDAWVNLCSYYAEDSLYQLASGTKRMIESGKIENFRFYGERDPMEQQYNLRAVSFCRHGSGFITRSSEVLTGTKDTRVPRVFGDPEPVNAVLGIGDHFRLRFNEAIAGNYLDEDNNFQLTGYTNESGIAIESSLHFDGLYDTYAASKVNRSLTNKSFTIDMLVKPDDPDADMNFFTYEYGEGQKFTFGKTHDNRLMAVVANRGIVESNPLPEKMTDFTRVIVTFDKEKKQMRFFAGTKEVTDSAMLELPDARDYSISGPFVFGQGFYGSMLEARLWTKALTTDEIANTHLRHLTGYEQELLAYYPMHEGAGNTVADKAHGATLYIQGATWNNKKGISLRVPEDKKVKLDGNLMGRSAAQDMTLMFWFRTAKAQGTIFSAGRIDGKHGSAIAFENGTLVFHNDSASLNITDNLADNEWHHVVLTVSRTFNNASIFIDDKQYAEIAATKLSAISGDMYFGGDGFDGFIDDYAVFEQALPKSLVESYGTGSPYGDEMGLMAYLPFSEMKENDNGIYEQVFSVNDQRVFKTTDGQVVDKVVPLVVEVSDKSDINDLAEKTEHAPVHTVGLLTKMNFDWSFNNDELLINLKMLDREINKQTIYVTVRDVEDLNGNPMASPVTWSAFVDRNSLKWESKSIDYWMEYGEYNLLDNYRDIKIFNSSGKRHQYTIESLPEWLSVDHTYGSILPLDEVSIRLYFDEEQAVGVYTDIIYLTDEDGLSEPLQVEMQITAFPPYDDVDESKFDQSMSLRGQVLLTTNDKSQTTYDTSSEDIVYVFCEGELVGSANNSYDNQTNQSMVYLMIHGNSRMVNKVLSFKLWQASTGRLFTLTPGSVQRFQVNAMRGYAPNAPIQLSVNPNAAHQQIALNQGWNWMSLNLMPASAEPNALFPYEQGFRSSDIVKAPSERQFAEFADTETESAWFGTLRTLDYRQMYMLRAGKELNLSVEGQTLGDDERTVTIYGNGWSSIAYLLDEPLSVTEALADYYSNAGEGDVIKSKTAVAVFSENHRWEGPLQTLRPGEGYLFRRVAKGAVEMRFIPQTSSNAPRKLSAISGQSSDFSNPNASANMTMIAKLDNGQWTMDNGQLKVYVGDELAAVAMPIYVEDEPLYFLTIQSDKVGDLRFEMEGQELMVKGEGLMVNGESVRYSADSHQGSLRAPVLLRPADDERPYKIIENDHVVIIRNNEKYDVTGKKL